MTDTEPLTVLHLDAFDPSGGHVPFEIMAGQTLFILGPNGTGKSALVQAIVQRVGAAVTYVPGGRPVYFDQEARNLTPASRHSLRTHIVGLNQSPTMRWLPVRGTDRNEAAVHDLQTSEIQYKVDLAEQVRREGAASQAIALLQSETSPLDRVNRLLSQGNLPVQVVVDNAELKASKGGTLYSIAKMSDGERSALILIGTVLSASARTIFVIDEPELHLHRSIVVPLVASLIRERSDCAFVVSTHELELPAQVPDSSVLLVRNCEWVGDAGSNWTLDLVPVSGGLPEDLRTDVLGSRRKILFIEGINTSLDQPLYALLFPLASVRSKEGCTEVRRAVVGLRSIPTLHQVEPFGLVDNDGMSTAEIAAHEADHVFPLRMYSVESLYYGPEVRTALAAHQATTFAVNASALLSDADAGVLAALGKAGVAEHLAARLSGREMREQVLAALPDRAALMASGASPVSISIPSPFAAEILALGVSIAARDIDGIIDRYPVRESGALGAIAKALRFGSRQDYERAALARVAADQTLRDQLKAKLGRLSAALS